MEKKEKQLVTRDLLFKKSVNNKSNIPAQVSQGPTKQIGRYGENISRDETSGIKAPTITAKKVENIPTGYQQAYDPEIGTVHVVSVSGPKMYEITKGSYAKKLGENTQLYQIIDINKDNLRFRAYTATGKLYDEFLLKKRKDQPNLLIETNS